MLEDSYAMGICGPQLTDFGLFHVMEKVSKQEKSAAKRRNNLP